MKIKAYQIPPERQCSPLIQYDEIPEEIEIFGNICYQERTSDTWRNIPALLDDIADEFYDLQRGEKPYTDFATILEAYTGRDSYTRAERKKWVEILHRWTDTDEETTVFIDVLQLIRNRKYTRATLRGCAQGEWQEILYPAEYGAEWLKSFETEYFNLGTEWIVHEDDEQFSIYCTTDNPRAEIAEATNATSGDVILYEFDGWTRTPKYREVQA